MDFNSSNGVFLLFAAATVVTVVTENAFPMVAANFSFPQMSLVSSFKLETTFVLQTTDACDTRHTHRERSDQSDDS